MWCRAAGSTWYYTDRLINRMVQYTARPRPVKRAQVRVAIASAQISRHSSGKSYPGEGCRMARHNLSRRGLIAGTVSLAGAAVVGRGALAQNPAAPSAQTGTPASTVTSPPRDWTPGRPSIYPD